MGSGSQRSSEAESLARAGEKGGKRQPVGCSRALGARGRVTLLRGKFSSRKFLVSGMLRNMRTEMSNISFLFIFGAGSSNSSLLSKNLQ